MMKINVGSLLAVLTLAGFVSLNTACSKNTKAEEGDISDQQSSGTSDRLGTEGVEDRGLVGIDPDQRAALTIPAIP